MWPRDDTYIIMILKLDHEMVDKIVDKIARRLCLHLTVECTTCPVARSMVL